MDNWRQIAHEAKDLLTVCLAKSIDHALTAQLGREWFLAFVHADAKEKVHNRITKPNQQSVQELDLQALLKFLRYRSTMTEQVLSYYGFFHNMDSFSMDGQRQQLNDLLERLINDFRNRIEAHSRAIDVEKELSGQTFDRIYGYEEAYQDMRKLAGIFATTTDNSGVSYHSRILALTKTSKQKQKKKVHPLFLIIPAVCALLISLLLWANRNTQQDLRPPEVRQGQVTVQPIQTRYVGKELVAICYVVNGTDEAISNIDVYSFRLTGNGQDIALADFGILQDATIDPGKAVQWQFRFPEGTVFVPNADLSDLQAHVLCDYE